MKSDRKRQISRCDQKWKEIILRRAGYRSEISGIPGKQIDPHGVILQAHHILRKPNYRLRYELDNGICLTIFEHKYGIHGKDEELYRRRIKEVKGKDIYDRLYFLRNETVKDIMLIEAFLDEELNRLKGKGCD